MNIWFGNIFFDGVLIFLLVEGLLPGKTIFKGARFPPYPTGPSSSLPVLCCKSLSLEVWPAVNHPAQPMVG